MMPSQGRRERSLAIALVLLAASLAIVAPGFFSRDNLIDLLLANTPVLIISLGATLVVVSGEIDISVGSVFAICSVVAALVSKAGVPLPAMTLLVVLSGAAFGALNGALVAWLRVPSIVVTLATMVGLRDGLRWATQGAWVQDLPASFQWLGTSQATYPVEIGALAALLVALMAWGARHLAAGRAVYATGSSASAARLVGLDVRQVKFWVFTLAGALTGASAIVNAARFNQVPSNSGIGLEMKVVAAVVVGGAVITGGRATFTGTVLGVALLSAIGPALTFLGVSAYWERAIQGAIIVAAVAADALRTRHRLPLDGALGRQADPT
jgi:rhamnose transport system permease protein